MLRTGIRLSALSLMLAASVAFGQGYPSRPIRALVGFGAGGSTDYTARLFADELGKRLGQPVVVENRAGAGGAVAAQAVKNSTPDGYMLFIGAATPFAPVFLKDNALDVSKGDLLPVSNLTLGDNLIFVRADVAGSFKELSEKAKTRRLKHGSIGPTPHMLMALAAKQFGWDYDNIPYKTMDQAIAALLAGDIDFVMSSLIGWQPHIDAGKVKVVGVLSSVRSTLAPSVPSIKELGGNVDAPFHLGLWAPPGTPRDVISKLNAAVVEAAKVPALAEKLRPFALVPNATTPEDLLRAHQAEMRVYGEAATLLNIQPQ